MHREIDGRLAGAEDIENDGILNRKIIEPVRIIPVFLRDAFQTPADDCCFVQVDIIDHGERTDWRSSLRRA